MLIIMSSPNNVESRDTRILVWNAQGAGGRDFMNTLKEHIRMHRPLIIVLLETHISGTRANEACNKIGFGGQFRVDPSGYQRGIWMLWLDNQLKLHLVEAHNQFITVDVNISENRGFLFTAIYANPHTAARDKLWAVSYTHLTLPTKRIV